MDMMKTVREIGFFETGSNLTEVLGSEDVQVKAGSVMPLPAENFKDFSPKIAEWITSFGKDKYMFLNPELALIDRLAEYDTSKESIIVIPCDMEAEVKGRLKGNVPKRMKVSLLKEPYFPEAFYPGNGLLIACGYLAGGRMMVLPETYRMIDHYSGFLGKKIFIPYVELSEAIRYDGWMEIGRDKINAVWRAE